MTIETETYTSLEDWRNAMKRTSSRHDNGWKMVTNSKTNLSIIWSDAPPNGPIPKRKLTRPQFEKELLNMLGAELV